MSVTRLIKQEKKRLLVGAGYVSNGHWLVQMDLTEDAIRLWNTKATLLKFGDRHVAEVAKWEQEKRIRYTATNLLQEAPLEGNKTHLIRILKPLVEGEGAFVGVRENYYANLGAPEEMDYTPKCVHFPNGEICAVHIVDFPFKAITTQ